MKKRYLIIGASAAGISAAAKIRQLDSEAEIICFTAEQEMPYNKCFLADYLSGLKTCEQTALRSEDFFKQQNINIKCGTFIKHIDAEKKHIICHKNIEHPYTKLLLATGGSVKLPELKGINSQHVFPFYTLEDTQTILDYAQQNHVKRVVIIGAGLSGLECADSLIDYVESIEVLEREKHVLARQITQEGAEFIQEKMQQAGVAFTPNVTVKEIKKDFVLLQDGTKVKADMVVCAIGARPNGAIGHNAGLMVNKGALVTNDFLTTSNEHIFAAGDCAQVKDKVTGKQVKSCTWPDAMLQGMVAGTNMVEPTRQYPGVVIVTSSAFFDVKFFSAGHIEESTSYNSVLRKHQEAYRLILHQDGVVKGFVLIGQTHGVADLKRSLLTGKPCTLPE